jgi:hypothetical protein
MTAVVAVAALVVSVVGHPRLAELCRRRRTRNMRPMAEPRSLVRVLDSEEELREAVARAVGYEQQLARAVADRIEHYQEAAPVAPVVALVRDAGEAFDPQPVLEPDSA